jgi:hypothetical protein
MRMSFCRSAVPMFLGLSLLAAAERIAVADGAPIVPLPDADRAPLETLLGKDVIGDPVPAPPLRVPSSYSSLHGATFSYQLLDSSGKRWSESHHLMATTEAQFAPGLSYSIDKVGVEFMQETPDGNLVIVGEQDLKQKVLTRFTPGEPLIIAGLEARQSRRVTVDVKVADLSDPTDITHTGSLDITYTYVGAYKVTVPAGAYEAALIRWDYKGDVGPASIKETYYRLIAPSTGLVAMVENVNISAMLVYNDHIKLGKQLEHME